MILNGNIFWNFMSMIRKVRLRLARFVKSVDAAFNLVNSSTRYSNKPMGNAIRDESIENIDEMIQMFKDLKSTTRK